MPFNQALIIYLISQIGKYLPGNIGHHVGRIVMARDIGIPAALTLSNVFIEVFWSAGIAAGLTLLFMLLTDTGISGVYWQINPLLLASCVVGLLLMPWLAINLMKKLVPDLLRRLSGGHEITAPTLTIAMVIAGLFILSFLSFGLILKIQADYFFGVTDINLIELTCMFAAAWLAGYVIPGAPGGLGVRESMMVLLLSPIGHIEKPLSSGMLR